MTNEAQQFTATYSVEDNKLRIYFSDYLDRDFYSRFIDLGFRNAPIQGCHFAAWTPEREDFAIELAGDIFADGTTLAERAQAKVERCERYASNNIEKSNAYQSAARSIASRFSQGQPVLVGHHSERSALRAKKQIETAKKSAIYHAELVSYWNSKATGAERHANYKNKAGVRLRRIETLLAELRSEQRIINDAYKAINLWGKMAGPYIESEHTFLQRVKQICGFSGMSPSIEGKSCFGLLTDGRITALEVYELSIDHHYSIVNDERQYRVINHLLNRLSYERSALGDVSSYTGKLTPVILQAFLRTHGADSPSVTPTTDGFKAVSCLPFPLHLNSNVCSEIELDDEGWRGLMVDCGYEVIEKVKSAKQAAPILNFKGYMVKTTMHGGKTLKCHEMTKEQFSRTHPDNKGTVLSSCGTFRVRAIYINNTGKHYGGEWHFVFLTDSKTHQTPTGNALINEEVAA